MKKLMSILLSSISFCIIWFLQVFIGMSLFVILGLIDPDPTKLSMSPIPGIIGLFSIYTSYLIIKRINKIGFKGFSKEIVTFIRKYRFWFLLLLLVPVILIIKDIILYILIPILIRNGIL